VIVANQSDAICTTRVGTANADLVMGCDPIVTAGRETTERMQAGRTHVVLNSYGSPTAAFVRNGQWQNPAEQCLATVAQAVAAHDLGTFDAERLATQLLGDSIYVNPMVLGFAWQRGWVPLRRESIARAMELNGVAVQRNLQAFEMGRWAAHDAQRLQSALAPAQVVQFHAQPTLDQLVQDRVQRLTRYQNGAYAAQYAQWVQQVQQAEQALPNTQGRRLRIAEAVARNLYKLMAYKDEYEVARLHSESDFVQRLQKQFEGPVKLQFHLAPPLLGRTDAQGRPRKQAFGPWMLSAFKLLARLKGLRGTPLNVFGYTHERRTERALIDQYTQTLQRVVHALQAQPEAHTLELAFKLAQLPEGIKGFGHVKARNLQAVQAQWAELIKQWDEATANARTQAQ
jgi:indolepyruvate ferredoxin oxidoreductase